MGSRTRVARGQSYVCRVGVLYIRCRIDRHEPRSQWSADTPRFSDVTVCGMNLLIVRCMSDCEVMFQTSLPGVLALTPNIDISLN